MTIRNIILTIAAAGTLTACNDIAADDRLILTDPVQPQRVVLLEDYTGQNCVNCPAAHERIEALQEQYPGQIVAVSIHAGSFGIPVERTNYETGYIGLMTDEGSQYNDHWGIDFWPAGVVNRRSGVLLDADWGAWVRDELERPSDVNLTATATLSEEGLITISTTIEPQADMNATIQVWILESGIVGRQRTTGGKTITDYVHNNVFRASANGHDGERLNLNKGIHASHTATITLRDTQHEKWNADALSAVVFIHTDSGVEQAIQVPVTKINL